MFNVKAIKNNKYLQIPNISRDSCQNLVGTLATATVLNIWTLQFFPIILCKITQALTNSLGTMTQQQFSSSASNVQLDELEWSLTWLQQEIFIFKTFLHRFGLVSCWKINQDVIWVYFYFTFSLPLCHKAATGEAPRQQLLYAPSLQSQPWKPVHVAWWPHSLVPCSTSVVFFFSVLLWKFVQVLGSFLVCFT